MILTVVFALAASFSNAVNVMTQHKASIAAPKREKGWQLVGYLFRQPLWLLGWIAAVGGFVFQALALHDGELSIVQPLLVTELVFVLMLRRVWIRQAIARAAWVSVLVVCVALAVFLTVAEPTGGKPSPETAQWLSALLVFGGAIAAAAAAGMRGSPVRRAAAFAVAGALAWALMAVFIKSATDTLAAFGIAGTLTRWPVYALAAAASGRHAARAVRAARRAAERVAAAAGYHQPAGQHRLERLAVRRALHRQPGEDHHRCPVLRRAGCRGHRAVADRAAGSGPGLPGSGVGTSLTRVRSAFAAQVTGAARHSGAARTPRPRPGAAAGRPGARWRCRGRPRPR